MVVNSKTATEIMDHVEDGKRVAVLVPSIQHAQRLMIDLVDVIDLPISDYKVYTSKREIQIGTGRVTIHSVRSSSTLRGMSLDLLYLEAGGVADVEDVLMAVMPTLNARGGELVRW